LVLLCGRLGSLAEHIKHASHSHHKNIGKSIENHEKLWEIPLGSGGFPVSGGKFNKNHLPTAWEAVHRMKVGEKAFFAPAGRVG